MIIYDGLGIKYESEKYEYDYNLIIDYENFSYKECHSILNYLYNINSLCYIDIIRLADIIIKQINIIKYDIIELKYRDLVKLIHRIFKILTDINNQTQRMLIYHNFNKFIKPKIQSNPSSPVSPPSIKKMKKPFKNKLKN